MQASAHTVRRVAGDLGQISIDPDGNSSVNILNTVVRLDGGQDTTMNIVGKTLVVYPRGDAKPAVACGTIIHVPVAEKLRKY